MITDFVTGKDLPNVGAEVNRQAIERFLVEQKGYLYRDKLLRPAQVVVAARQ